MFSSLALVLRDPLLRLILAGLFLVGVAVSSVMPFASLVGVERFGLADATYSSILFAASLVTVSASIVIGIVSDQRANRRKLLVATFAIAAVGYFLVFAAKSPLVFAVAHMTLIPLGGTAFSQLFALARIAVRTRAPDSYDEIFGVVRASFSLAFVITPPLWSMALASGADLTDIYISAGLATVICFALVAIFWPAGAAGALEDTRSGLGIVAALKEMLAPSILARMLAVGFITGSNQLYMVLFGLLIVREIGGETADVGRFHGAIALLEIPFMLMCGIALRRLSKPRLIALGGTIYAGFLFLFASMTSMAVAYWLVVPAALGAAVILSVSISYLQDLMSTRPGAGAALMAASNFVGQMVAAIAFAVGTAVTSYAGTAVIGGMLALAGVTALLAMDSRSGQARARA